MASTVDDSLIDISSAILYFSLYNPRFVGLLTSFYRSWQSNVTLINPSRVTAESPISDSLLETVVRALGILKDSSETVEAHSLPSILTEGV
jgi:hypothetical protein